jgi:signal transduction histidine kinase
VIGSTQPVHDGRWVVFAEIPTREAYANTRRALWMLQSVALLIGLSLLLSTSLAMDRIIIRPLKLLRNGAWRIGRGDLAFRIRLDKQNEIGQAADAFDQMAADLQHRETALAQARDQAMAASQFKSRLLANVSHDLRTPLNGIIGFTDILREGVYGPLTDRQCTALERILANTNRLLALVNSLLDQSQIEAGQIRIETTDFAPADLVREMESVMGVLAQQKGLKLETSVDPALPVLLRGDAIHLQQVLINLVDNAVKFCDQGTVRAHIYPEDGHWIIQVSDTGRGIPPDSLATIFEPFQQVDGSVTRDQRGVGLGLSIVQQLVHLMGGTVSVDSHLDQGSTFTVRLPLIPSKELAHA